MDKPARGARTVCRAGVLPVESGRGHACPRPKAALGPKTRRTEGGPDTVGRLAQERGVRCTHVPVRANFEATGGAWTAGFL